VQQGGAESELLRANAATAPYNQKTLTRHYGFGNTPGTVTIAGQTANCTGGGNSWSNTQLICTVPNISAGQSSCGNGANQTPFQRTTPLSVGNSARCGQLEITAANGKRSIDAITVTVAGKPPTVVTRRPRSYRVTSAASGRARFRPDRQRSAGDLIIVAPGTYREKPAHVEAGAPARRGRRLGHDQCRLASGGKMDSWRRQVTCLFGLTIDGAPNPAMKPSIRAAPTPVRPACS